MQKLEKKYWQKYDLRHVYLTEKNAIKFLTLPFAQEELPFSIITWLRQWKQNFFRTGWRYTLRHTENVRRGLC